MEDERIVVSHWLEELKLLIPVEVELEFNQHGLCSLDYNGVIEIIIEVPTSCPSFYFCAYLGGVPKALSLQIYKALLNANYFNLKTRGTTLAFDELSEQVVLCHSQLVKNSSSLQFQDLFSAFLEIAEYWHEQLKSWILSQNSNEKNASLGNEINANQSEPEYIINYV